MLEIPSKYPVSTNFGRKYGGILPVEKAVDSVHNLLHGVDFMVLWKRNA